MPNNIVNSPTQTLLIEDRPTIRESLIPAMLDVANAEVIGVAETAADAIRLLTIHSLVWQLSVVDLFLRSGSGIEVVRAAQGRHEGQRVVVLTNYATEDMRRVCLKFGADAIFDKSTEIESFFEYCIANFQSDSREWLDRAH